MPESVDKEGVQTDAPHTTAHRGRQRTEDGSHRLPHTPDPRETEDWFLRLPPSVQEEFRLDWYTRSEKYQRYINHSRRRRPRTLIQGMTMISIPVALGAACQGVASPIPFGLAFGLLAGYGWSRFGAGRLWSCLTGMAAASSAIALGGGSAGIQGLTVTVVGTALAGLLCAYGGLQREIDRREMSA